MNFQIYAKEKYFGEKIAYNLNTSFWQYVIAIFISRFCFIVCFILRNLLILLNIKALQKTCGDNFHLVN